MTHSDKFLSMSRTALTYIMLHQLYNLLNLLQEMQSMLTDAGSLKQQRDDISEEYRLLIAQAATGQMNEQCKAHHQALMQRCILLLQSTRRHRRLEKQSDTYAHTFALINGENTLTEEEKLFNEIWTSDQMKENTLSRYMLCADDDRKKQVVASALSLALLEYFDPNKYLALLTLSTDTCTPVRAKALLGIFMAAGLHNEFFRLFPYLEERSLQILNVNDLLILQQQICLVQENDRLQSRFKYEIIPNVLKAHKGNMPTAAGTHEVKINLSKDDPMLPKRLQRLIAECFHQMSKLVSDGIDATPTAFDENAHFPFFAHVSHWLLPFDGSLVSGKLTGEIAALDICDTDKNALALVLNATPNELAEKLLFQLKKRVLAPHSESGDEDYLRNMAYRNAVQDMIRLLRNSKWEEEWPKVLKNNVLLISFSLFRNLIKDNRTYYEKSIVLYRKYDRYGQLKNLLEQKIRVLGAAVSDYLGLAVCEHELKNDPQAVRYLRMAEALSPSDFQILDLLQQAYTTTGQVAARTDVLLEMEKLKPEDTDITLSLAECLVQQKMWKEAMQRFYKLEFSERHLTEALRGVAWCAFMQGNLPRARQYYNKILASQYATWEEWLNSGHLAWKEGNIPLAIRHYVESTRKYLMQYPQTRNALKPFNDDEETLRSLNFGSDEIGLMHDLIANAL